MAGVALYGFLLCAAIVTAYFLYPDSQDAPVIPQNGLNRAGKTSFVMTCAEFLLSWEKR